MKRPTCREEPSIHRFLVKISSFDLTRSQKKAPSIPKDSRSPSQKTTKIPKSPNPSRISKKRKTTAGKTIPQTSHDWEWKPLITIPAINMVMPHPQVSAPSCRSPGRDGRCRRRGRFLLFAA